VGRSNYLGEDATYSGSRTHDDRGGGASAVAESGTGATALAEQESRVFYRIIAGEEPGLSDFISQKVQGVPRPVTDDAETLFSWEHGVSVTNTQRQAIKKARGMRGRLGRYVVGVRVEGDGPVRYLKTLGSGHFDLIGAAADILERVVLPAEGALVDEQTSADG
jgi:hypothetical protein